MSASIACGQVESGGGGRGRQYLLDKGAIGIGDRHVQSRVALGVLDVHVDFARLEHLLGNGEHLRRLARRTRRRRVHERRLLVGVRLRVQRDLIVDKERGRVRIASLNGAMEEIEAALVALVYVDAMLDQVGGDARLSRAQRQVQRQLVLLVRLVQFDIQLSVCVICIS